MALLTWQGIGRFAAAALLISSIGAHQTYAQSGNTPTQPTEKSDKDKPAEKKTTAKPAGPQTNTGQPAPMSGYRPDPVSNY